MNRTRGIIAAGALTGLVIVALLAVGFTNLVAAAVRPAESAADAAPLPDTSTMTDAQALQAWQEYAGQLEQTVRTLQARDAQYQQQLDVANTTILQLQDQINATGTGAIRGEREEHEEHEAEEHGFFFGERDDD